MSRQWRTFLLAPFFMSTVLLGLVFVGLLVGLVLVYPHYWRPALWTVFFGVSYAGVFERV